MDPKTVKTFAISLLRGTAVALVAAVPLWWVPTFMQYAIPDFWLAAMTVPPLMLGGYVAARRAQRPVLTGALTGLVATFVILSIVLAQGEAWVIPVMLSIGAAFSALGAFVAVLAGHAAP